MVALLTKLDTNQKGILNWSIGWLAGGRWAQGVKICFEVALKILVKSKNGHLSVAKMVAHPTPLWRCFRIFGFYLLNYSSYSIEIWYGDYPSLSLYSQKQRSDTGSTSSIFLALLNFLVYIL